MTAKLRPWRDHERSNTTTDRQVVSSLADGGPARPRDIACGRFRENVIRLQCRYLTAAGLLEQVATDTFDADSGAVTTLDSMASEEPASGDKSPTPEEREDAFHEPKTPLEDVIRVPEHLVEDSLSANQARARFVAKDVHQYSRSVPAGRAIKSSELRRVLSARDGGRTYTETVSRVIEFLDELGKDSVAVKETQSGERVVVFTDEIVKRIVAYNNQSNTVVTGGEVSA